MSGYGSKSEAVEVVKRTILLLAPEVNLPDDLKAFYVNRIVDDVVINRGHRYGYALDISEEIWRDSLKRHVRKSFFAS